MKIEKLKKQVLSMTGAILLNACLLFNATAQNEEMAGTINDRSLMSKIEKQADDALQNKEWAIAKLKNAIKDLKETDRAKTVLPKAGSKLMNSEEIYEKCSKGVIMVGTYYNCGNCDKMHTALASGAILNEQGVCVTNYHVLEDIITGVRTSKSRDSIAFVGTIDGKIFLITDILSFSKAGDVAIFKIDPAGEKLHAIPLGVSAKTGQKVHAITHPNGYHYYYSEGIVARNVSKGEMNPNGDRMEITADYARGSSGGPILDSYGNLIGMVSTTSSIYYDERDQKNLQMVIKSTIPVSTVKRLIL